MMKFLFKYPTMGRPEWFKETLQKYMSMLSGKHEYLFLLTMNEDDPTMNNPKMIEWIENLDEGKMDIVYRFGVYGDKIEAINADVSIVTNFDILFLISDDMIPLVTGFDDLIVKAMEVHFPDLDGALHYHDGCCGKDKCITLSIMGKKLYDTLGYIYHSDYKSFYCDNEFTDVVRQMNKVVYIPTIIVKHEWQGWGKDRDTIYNLNTQKGKDDEQTYKGRKKAGFPK